MNHDTPANAKFAALQTVLGLARYEAVGVLESLWILTRTSKPQGDIGGYSNERIAASIGWTGDADALIAGLVCTGWLDEHPEHRLVVHDWHIHAPQYIKRRMARTSQEFAVTSHDYPVTSHGRAVTSHDVAVTSISNITEHNIREEEEYVGLATDPPAPEKHSAEIEAFTEAWNEMAAQNGLATIRDIKPRLPELRQRLKSKPWRESWREALALIPASDFLCGRQRGSTFRATPDFFIKPKTLAKIIGGNYANRGDNGAAVEQITLESMGAKSWD